jgi:tetratricopeptide (TPR) repeat protein
MSGHPVSVRGRGDATEAKQELLGRLGLRVDATDHDVEAAHDGLVEFLELAPHDVKSWAAAATADVDEAFALLSGPETELAGATQLAGSAQSRLNQTPPAPARRPAPVAAAAPVARPLSGAPVVPTRKPRRNQLIGGGLVVALIAVVLGVYYAGKGSSVPGISGTPTASATTAPSNGPTPVPVDPAKVTALMQKITTNPKDAASLQALGDIYFAATDYKNASVWEQKILTIDPKNQVALLSLGAAEFNVGNNAGAKKEWLIAAGLYPKVAEVHYDLGFLYMSQTPPDSVNMTAEWKKVVAIDPNSALAKSVSTHMASSVPTTSATPSAK